MVLSSTKRAASSAFFKSLLERVIYTLWYLCYRFITLAMHGRVLWVLFLIQHCERCYLSFMHLYYLCKLHAQKLRLASLVSIMLGVNNLKAFVSVIIACQNYWVPPNAPFSILIQLRHGMYSLIVSWCSSDTYTALCNSCADASIFFEVLITILVLSRHC